MVKKTPKITAFFSAKSSGGGDADKGEAAPLKKRNAEEDESEEGREVRAKIQKMAVQEEAVVEMLASIGTSWFTALEDQFDKPYFAVLAKFVAQERRVGEVFPSREDVWAWTSRTNIKDTKVVILGQDPYPTPGNAHGLCFSVSVGVPHPQSLKNIFTELEDDIPGFSRPSHGHLGGWADQGVLLLNAVLTVRKGEPNSHKNRGWETLTSAVIDWISANCENVVFLLWGGYAQKKAAKVDQKRHHVLKAAHPSPLSANRGGWFGCGHFSKCNELLVAAGHQKVDWGHLPRQ